MINKQKNDERVELLRKIGDKYQLSDIGTNVDDFKKTNAEYHAHILMVGGFSAGKSALLNKYIGKSILNESQSPETAFASELKFSENERILEVLNDGNIEEVTDVNSLSSESENISNLVYYVDSENIKLHADYTMVDTPGFDSGLERHNQALMQYIGKGTAYILVVDCEKGTVSESALNFLNEIINYSTDIAVVITKCDKKIPSEVEKIRDYISNLLLANTGMELPVITTSIFDEEVVEKLNKLVVGFDAQYLYDKNITSQVDYIKELLIKSLTVIQSSASCDTKTIEEEIARREEAKEVLLKNIETKRRKIRSDVRNTMKSTIIADVATTLESQADALARVAMTSPDMLQQRLVEIVRPILIRHIEEYTEISTASFVKGLNVSSLENLGEDINLGETLTNIYEKIKDMVDRKMIKLPNLGKVGNLADVGSKTGLGSTLYRSVTSALAITTSAIAPIFELLIVFLPDIINLVRGLFSESKEDKAANAIRKDVIPQVVSKLNTELDAPLQEVEAQMIDGVVATIQELIDTENKALEVAKAQLNNELEKHSHFLKGIQEDIDFVKGI
ncbi:dynamin family protein [Veillonella sp. VA139]|uniref:dynamin family protein n=1 Tax=Veillonella sp. VA139 TaxID=741830 RepID=UPI0013DE7F0F|nr:dynamin family protein [Veillonella sp. VA139]